jgi:GT2 family glycosyltransferase/glycosyltransferase involved in cell wall biosynthesis
VVCFETLEHIAEHDQFIAEVRRVLRPDGVLLISTPEKTNYDAMIGEPNPHHELELSREEFSSLIARHFPSCRLYGQRVLYASCLAPLAQSADDFAHYYQYDDERRGIRETTSLDRPTYLIAVASTGVLPVLPAGLYEGRFQVNLLSSVLGGVRERDEKIIALSDESRHAEQRILETERRLDEVGEQLAETERRLAATERPRAETEQRLAETEQRLAETEQRRAETEQCLAETEQRRAETEQRRAETGQRLAEIESSRTWRYAQAFAIRPAVRLKASAKNVVGRVAAGAKRTVLAGISRLPISAAGKARLERVALRVYRKAGGRPTLSDVIIPVGDQVFAPVRASKQLRHRPERERLSPTPRLDAEGPEVSIVVPVFNKIDFTQQCLDAIEAYTHGVGYEVIVVDDHSTDGTPAALARRSGIRYLRNDENLGFIGSCNAGAAAALGRYLVILNNDTEVMTNWLVELVDTFHIRPDAGLVGAKLLYPNGVLQEAGGIIWQDGSGWNYGRTDHASRPEYNYLREVDYVSGACIMLPKALWDQLGGFDAHYAPAYGEDSDLAFRVRERGLRVYYQPMAEVIHYEGITSGRDLSAGIKAYQVENARKLFERWKHRMADHGPPGVEPEREKERSVKHRMLVIDACTPTPDRDAGSITALGIMSMCQHLGYKVTFIPESNFTWIDKYSDALARIGIESIVYPFCERVDQHLADRGSTYDVVMIFRGGIAAEYLKIIRERAPQAKIVFHTSDLHYLRLQREAEVKGSSTLALSASRTKTAELRVISGVDCTIVHSTEEKEILEQREGVETPIVLFPWILDIKARTKAFSERRDIFFLGGYQHPANIDAVTYFVEEIWPLISRRLPGTRFLIVGSNAPETFQTLGDDSVVFRGFVDDLDDLMAEARLSVAPLRYGAGIKGKIATCMAYGVPVVTTTIGAEGMSLRDGEDVLVADDPEAFADAVVSLYQNADLWMRLSQASQDFVEQHYSSARGEQIMREVLLAAGAPVDR